jgi:hypothetical protein
MRSISAGGLAKLASKMGTEPIVIIEVDWVSGDTTSYADRTVESVLGRIVEVSGLDNVIDVTQSNNSQEISITLDDTDGSIKAIMDTHDVHQRDVRVYQWFDGLALSDRFLLLSGKISSPVIWSEKDRTVSFSLVSQLEDKEIGFSAEEGQFPYLPKDLVGKAWPMIFGKVLDCPALQVNHAISGTSLCGVGILSGADKHATAGLGPSPGLAKTLALGGHQIGVLNRASAAWSAYDRVKASDYLDQANQIRRQMGEAIAAEMTRNNCAANDRRTTISDAEKEGLGCNPVRILGGEDFPQNTGLTLSIGGGLFTGHFENDQFYISSRRHPENEAAAEEELNVFRGLTTCIQQEYEYTPFDYSVQVPCGEGDILNPCLVRSEGFIITKTENNQAQPDQVAQHFWADSGSNVTVAGDEPITCIVSITPGQVLAVKAYKTLNHVRNLCNVPDGLWTVEVKNYGPIPATQIVLRKPLSSIVDQGWEDDLYVTYESTIGPNIVDIVRYLVDTYSDLECDEVSFAAVREKLAVFPANFPILDRRNIVEVLKDIAFQARCAVWISNGVVYLKYLAEEPTADDSITLSDMDSEVGIELELTSTEDLCTKMVVTWRLSYAAEEPEKMIFRHNVARYGTHEREFDFYIYNQPDIIQKVATFWLIRLANTWKRVRFRTFLNKLNLETFDTVLLQFGIRNYVANGDIKAVIEKASYDSSDQTIEFECLAPVKAGKMETYPFFWPANVDPSLAFPTAEEVAEGRAGGGGIGAEAWGELPVGPTDTISDGDVVFVGGPNVVYRARSDWGDRHPSDRGFQAQPVVNSTTYAELSVRSRPKVNLRLRYPKPVDPPKLPGIGQPELTLDIRHTKIIDSQNRGVIAYLSSIVQGINQQEILLKTGVKFASGEHPDGREFDFKYDEEGGKFGAGTAFLKD